MNKPTNIKGSAVSHNAIADRIAKNSAAFKTGRLRKHSVVNSFATGDAVGQRGWGPMMQT
jgi:hypothetical protein